MGGIVSERTLDPDHVAWCGQLFRMLNVGGIWGVPRSGLVFTRTDEATLTLTARMPHDPAMPITPAQLDEQQQEEYEACAAHFTAAGVTVTDATRETT